MIRLNGLNINVSVDKDGWATCEIFNPSSDFLQDTKISNIPYEHGENGTIKFYGSNCIDLLGSIGGLSYLARSSSIGPNVRIFRADPAAILPSKERASDVGYDLTIIKECKKMGDYEGAATLYDTGIQLQVATGCYAEVVPRSSLSKSGYMLANGTGIIDPSYTGNLMVALVKVVPDAPDIQLPFRCCQIIFREQFHANIVEVHEEIAKTTRGAGGFGSTG
jgi:deoxyuridine 5'-triphosphate nucleotidohydrolase